MTVISVHEIQQILYRIFEMKEYVAIANVRQWRFEGTRNVRYGTVHTGPARWTIY